MTSTQLARQPRAVALKEWDEEFARLVKATVLKPKNRDATDAELALFAEQAQRTGLDPMTRQIYGVFRYDKRAGGEVMTVQVGIDGLRLIAERSGAYLGQAGPFWCGDDGAWTETWFAQTPPRAAKVVVRKAVAGQVAETPAVAHFDEYVPLTRDGKPMSMWADKPALMLAKCAEALALRKAFPNDMSGLYTDDEMHRADVSTSLPQRAVQRGAASPSEGEASTVAVDPSDGPPVVDAEEIQTTAAAERMYAAIASAGHTPTEFLQQLGLPLDRALTLDEARQVKAALTEQAA